MEAMADKMRYISKISKKMIYLFLPILMICLCGWKMSDGTPSKEYNFLSENPYFFPDSMEQKEYEGYFVPPSFNEIKQNINLNIQLVFRGGNGSLYSLELDDLQPTEDPMDYIIMSSRHLGYFYVSEDAIYRIGRKTLKIRNPIACKVFETAWLMQLIQRIDKNDSTLFSERNIVCNENGTDDAADENGWHEYVEADGEKRIFHMYNDYSSGTKQYEQIVWEKGKGITYYLSGSGNMVMHIELSEK